MAGAKQKREIVIANCSALALTKGFGKYKPEDENAVRKVEVVENETLRQLKKAWGNYTVAGVLHDLDYLPALALAEKLEYTAADVEKFCIALAEFQDEKHFSKKAGLFLSALINNGKDTDYVIHTKHLVRPMECICFQNTKNVIVKGNALLGIGWDMKRGQIIVEGDADHLVGLRMRGGSITVKGNAGEWVGSKMTGGKIRLEGGCKSIATDATGGQIFRH
ncbi:MAG: hypothetical protein PHF60_03075 [Candidatus ainarchaeum sp.]|nr:hypothetical protein [Candidatus ainarchaeum sp.]